MRVFLGIIIGVFLTIASAYVIDSVTTGPATAPNQVSHRSAVRADISGASLTRRFIPLTGR